MDYCFLAFEGRRLHTVLIARERSSRMTMSSIVPHKEASEEWVFRMVLAFVIELGLDFSRVSFRSDQENAIMDVRKR